MFSSISRLWSSEPSSAQYSIPDPANDLPAPGSTRDIEKDADKPTRTLRHLVKLNHANFALYNEPGPKINSIPDALTATHALGASSETIDRIYEQLARDGVAKWTDSPGEISRDDWMDFLGQPSYQRAYLDFFEDEVVEMGYHWREMTMRYLFHEKRPLIQGIMSAGGRPLLRLGYGLAISSREMTMEGLALLATGWQDDLLVSSSVPLTTSDDDAHSADLLYLLGEFSAASRDLSNAVEVNRLVDKFTRRWKIDSIAEAMKSAQKVAALLVHCQASLQVDSADILIATDGLRSVLYGVPVHQAVSALLGWWRVALRSYARAGCPKINVAETERSSSGNRGWTSLIESAIIKTTQGADTHALLMIHALRAASESWPGEEVFLNVAREINI